MNSTICCTSGLAENIFSTSSSRSIKRALAREQHAIGLAQLVDLLAGKAMALEADDVESGERGAVAEHHAEGNDILLDPRHAADEGMGADAHELMHGGEAADDGVIADRSHGRRASRC